jgi:hypothetical protein
VHIINVEDIFTKYFRKIVKDLMLEKLLLNMPFKNTLENRVK